MAASEAFELVCAALEDTTPLARLEARGTVRLALKASGLEVASVTPEQMAVVVERVMPQELTSRGLGEIEPFQERALAGLQQLASDPDLETPDAVFRRLARATESN